MVAEVDILRSEGVYYAKLLKRNSIPVVLREYKGAPHMVLGLGGMMESGRWLVLDMINAIEEVLSRDSQSWYGKIKKSLRVIRIRASLGLPILQLGVKERGKQLS